METIAQAASQALQQAKQPAPTFDWRPTLDAYDASLKRAADAAARFVAEIAHGRPGRWLTLAGNVGCGKTMLARQIFHEAAKHNHLGNAVFYQRSKTDEDDRRPNCVWLDMTAFAERLRAGEYDLPEYLGRDFIVVLDDIGASRDKNDFLGDALFRFCNARLGKWTVFTTNLGYSDIAATIDPRVASRMVRDENEAIKITASDYALRKKSA